MDTNGLKLIIFFFFVKKKKELTSDSNINDIFSFVNESSDYYNLQKKKKEKKDNYQQLHFSRVTCSHGAGGGVAVAMVESCN